MDSSSNQKRLAQFGPYQADLRTGELRKHGIRLRLQEQPFQVLAMLLSNPGELVTREELQKRLWPADTFVDFDHGLNTAINKLREVLSDSSATPKYIETLPRRGYRFLAAVQLDNGVSAAGGSSAHPSTSSGVPVSGAHAEVALPKAPRPMARGLFLVLQAMYLVFYIVTLTLQDRIPEAVGSLFGSHGMTVAVVALVSAVVGIAIRLFFFSGVALDFPRIGQIFLRVFPFVLLIDELWAMSPLLIWRELGSGIALAAVAALVWAPFAQRTLIRMAYSGPAQAKA
jgi:DNA-binding winged helix-turn-helix (wHTH) protein